MKQKCEPCGGKARWDCPALDAPICSACCGAGRNSRYVCPDDCPKNPLGNEDYDALLKIESAVDGGTILQLRDALGGREALALIEKAEARAARQQVDPLLYLEPAISNAVFYRRDAEGRTIAECWAAAGYPGLNNDGRSYMERSERPRVMLLEVQRALGGPWLEAVNLLAPEAGAFRLRDRGLAARATPFTVIFGWVRPLGREVRLRGAATFIERGVALDRFTGELRAALTEGGMERLVDKFHHFRALPGEFMAEERAAFLARLDPKWCQSFFRLNAAQKVLRWLAKSPEFDPADDEPDAPELQDFLVRYDWLRRGRWLGAPRSPISSYRISPDGESIECFGPVTLFSDFLMLENAGSERHRYLRAELEEALAGWIVFDREVVRDMNPDRRDRKAPEKPRKDRVPVAEAERAAIIAAHMTGHYRALLDEAVPALGDHTPRALALSKSPADRALLHGWAKDHAYNLTRNPDSPDLSWFFDELGLSDLAAAVRHREPA